MSKGGGAAFDGSMMGWDRNWLDWKSRSVFANLLTWFFLWLLTLDSEAADSKVSFDANGNLAEIAGSVIAPPVITKQPVDHLVEADASASFSVVVEKSAGLSYQWKKDGVDISGAIADSLFLSNVGASDVGSYTVVVTNSSGSVTSAAAELKLDSDGDGMDDAAENLYFGDLDEHANGDFDNDGIRNGDELEDGTDPSDTNDHHFHLTRLAMHGVIVASPVSITGRYAFGTVVSLEAVPVVGSSFTGWSGYASGSTNPISVTMDQDRSVTALFESLVPLEEALDGPGLTWTTGGGHPWLGVASQGLSRDGVDVGRSALGTLMGEESWIETTVTGPGLVSFWWKKESAEFELLIDNVLHSTNSSGNEWNHETIRVGAGDHTLRWRHQPQ